MANYSTLKAAVANVVKTNGVQEITGANLQTVLLSIINSIGGVGYIFKGVATPSTSAGTPDENVFYLAGAGTYDNFGTSVLVPPTNIAVFKYDGTWTCEQVTVESGGVFDISAFNAVGGTLATYADLASALGTNGANIPEGVRKGGMSIKFVQSSDNKYVQYRLMSDTFNTNVANWQNIEDVKTYAINTSNLINSVINLQSDSAGWVYIDLDVKANTIYTIKAIKGTVTGVACLDTGVPAPQKEKLLILVQAGQQRDFKFSVNGGRIGAYCTAANTEIEIFEKETSTQKINDTINAIGLLLEKGIYRSTVVATLDNISVGEKIHYHFTAVEGKTGYLAVNSSTTTLERIGKTDLDSGALEYEGVFEIPANFNQIIIVTNDVVNIDYIEKNVGNNILKKEIDALDNKLTDYIYKSDVISTAASLFFDRYCDFGESVFIKITNLSKGLLTLSCSLLDAVPSTINVHVIKNLSILPNQSHIIQVDWRREDIHIFYMGVVSANEPLWQFTVYKNNPNIFMDNGFMVYPRLGFGKIVTSRLEDTYAHNTRIINDKDEVDIIWSSNMLNHTEDLQSNDNDDTTLVRIDKNTGARTYVRIFGNLWQKDFYNGYPITIPYCHTAAKKGKNIHIITGCHYDNDTNLGYFYKTYNLSNGQLSNVDICKLRYNNITVDWSWFNYINMLNVLYDANIDTPSVLRSALDTHNITEYNGVYYMVIIHAVGDSFNIEAPWVLMSSTDLVTWEPVANLGTNKTGAETAIAVSGGKILVMIRHSGLSERGTYYMVTDLNGNITKQLTKVSAADSKPAAFVYNDRLFAIYNVPNSKTVINGGRTKINLCELDANNELNIIETCIDQDGYNYYDVSVYNTNILMSNTCRVRGDTESHNPPPVGTLTLQSLQIE